jgi:hypothetical protein
VNAVEAGDAGAQLRDVSGANDDRLIDCVRIDADQVGGNRARLVDAARPQDVSRVGNAGRRRKRAAEQDAVLLDQTIDEGAMRSVMDAMCIRVVTATENDKDIT